MLKFKQIALFAFPLALVGASASWAGLTLDPGTGAPCPQPEPIHNPLPTDANYFIDADQLRDNTPSHGHNNTDRLPADRQRFCSRTDADIIDPLLNFPNTNGALAFENPLGPLKTGSCWMHVRFQRSISYLGDFHPEQPKPTPQQVDQIISDLISMDHVVRIPGFRSVQEFSAAYSDKMSSAIARWYTTCLVTAQCSFNRAGDRSSENPDAMQARMDHIYNRVWPTPQMQFLRIHSTAMGITDSHVWLLLDMQPTHPPAVPGNPFSGLTRNGYTLRYVDPNDPANVQTYTYHYGDRSLFDADGNGLLPYEDYDGDLVDIRKGIANYCATPTRR